MKNQAISLLEKLAYHAWNEDEFEVRRYSAKLAPVLSKIRKNSPWKEYFEYDICRNSFFQAVTVGLCDYKKTMEIGYSTLKALKEESK